MKVLNTCLLNYQLTQNYSKEQEEELKEKNTQDEENVSAGVESLTRATKCSRFMPGLLDLVSARDRREDNLKPAAFPAEPPCEEQNTAGQHRPALCRNQVLWVEGRVYIPHVVVLTHSDQLMRTLLRQVLDIHQLDNMAIKALIVHIDFS